MKPCRLVWKYCTKFLSFAKKSKHNSRIAMVPRYLQKYAIKVLFTHMEDSAWHFTFWEGIKTMTSVQSSTSDIVSSVLPCMLLHTAKARTILVNDRFECSHAHVGTGKGQMINFSCQMRFTREYRTHIHTQAKRTSTLKRMQNTDDQCTTTSPTYFQLLINDTGVEKAEIIELSPRADKKMTRQCTFCRPDVPI